MALRPLFFTMLSRRNAGPLGPALPLGNEVLRDVEIAREHRLRDSFLFANSLDLFRRERRGRRQAVSVELAHGLLVDQTGPVETLDHAVHGRGDLTAVGLRASLGHDTSPP